MFGEFPCNGRCELVISVSLCCLPAGHYRGLFCRCFVGGVSFVSFGLFLSFYIFFNSIVYFFCNFFLFFLFIVLFFLFSPFIQSYPVLSLSPLSPLLSYPILHFPLLFSSPHPCSFVHLYPCFCMCIC